MRHVTKRLWLGVGYPSLIFLLSATPTVLADRFSDQLFAANIDTFRVDGVVSHRTNNWDGAWYQSIVEKGYYYEIDGFSSVAFFPVYPLICGIIRRATLLDSNLVMAFTSNASLWMCFLLLNVYLRRFHSGLPVRANGLVLWSFGLYPMTFFYHMGYTEPLFLGIFLLFMFCLRSQDRRYHLLRLALIAGLASGTRSTGLVLSFFVLVAILRDKSFDFRRKIALGVVYGPLACSGLIAFIIFLQIRFNAPFAFAEAQNWFENRPKPGFFTKVYSLLTYEPFIALYSDHPLPPLGTIPEWSDFIFNLHFADPIFLLTIVLALVYGWTKDILVPDERLISFLLIGFSYYFIGYESLLRSQGRYSSIVFPAFISLGVLLSRLPRWVAFPVLALWSLLQFFYASRFLQGYQTV